MGIGLAGLVDSIVFHEILQWHHVISNIVVPSSASAIKYNVFIDGIFLAITMVAIVVGIGLEIGFLSRSGNRVPRNFMRPFLGLILIGFGAFNVYDWIVDHLVLKIHHAKDGINALPFDIGFLVGLGFAFVAAGSITIRKQKLIILTTTEPKPMTGNRSSHGDAAAAG
jgi:uncharacterized membrane protein